MTIAADASAKLMELRQAEALRVLDNHHARIRHVDADFDDRRRDEDVQLARRERFHHAILAVAFHAAVQQADAVRRKHFRRKVVRHLGRRFQVDFQRLLHERIDHVRLPSRVELCANERVHVVATRFRLGDGRDREPSGRHVMNDRHVEIAIHRERERARDRRRRHDEHVGMQPLRPQRRALHHAESMLLVDDHEAELFEADIALHERMRAHHERDRPRLHFSELLTPCGGRRRPGQQRDAEARGLEQTRDVQEMLLGENLGRRHEGDLQSVFHLDDGRQQRNYCFTCADVPLEEPVHRLRPLQIVDDFLQRLLLAVGQAERQHTARRLADAIVDAHRDRFALARGKPAPRDDAHLKEKRFLEDQPPLRRRREEIQRVE